MVKASKAAVLATFEPVVATLIGIGLYHEKLTWDICLGVALIIFNHWGRNVQRKMSAKLTRIPKQE